MGSSNVGSSVHVFSYKQALTSKGFNALDYKIKVPGIYDGCEVEKINDSSVLVKPGTFIVNDDDAEVTVKVKTESNITLSVSSIDYMIVFRMTWVDTTNNYIDCLALEPGEVETSDVVIGKLSYSGASLNAIDYSYRTFGNQNDEKVLLEPDSAVFWIKQGTNFWYINGWTIKHIQETIKSNYLTLSTTGTYYLQYDGTSYSLVSDTVVMSYNFEKNGYYTVVDQYRILARIAYTAAPTNEFGVIETYCNDAPVMDNFKKYLDSAQKQIMSYNSSNILTSITYYNNPSVLMLGTTMAIESFTYDTTGDLTESQLAIYYPAGTLWKTYIFTYDYTVTLSNASGNLGYISYTVI